MITLLLLFRFLSFQSQEKPDFRLLLSSDNIQKRLIDTGDLYRNNYFKQINDFTQSIFKGLTFSDSIYEYTSIGFTMLSLDSSNVYAYEIKVRDPTTFDSIKAKIRELATLEYLFFDKYEIEDPSYDLFVRTGILLAIDEWNKSIIILHLHSCLFKYRTEKALRYLLKMNSISHIYNLTCGGKRLVITEK